MTNKEQYDLFCERNPQLPVFYQEWWLDLAYNKAWDTLIYKEGEEILAIMPYCIKTKLHFKTIMPPMLTPFSGPYISLPQNLNNNKKYSLENKILQDFAQKINKKKLAFFTQKFNYEIKNWLGFLWNGFSATTHYSYRFTNIEDLDYTFNNIDKEYRRKIKKQESNLFLTEEISCEEFYKINLLTYQKQNTKCPFSYEFFKQMDEVCTQKKVGKKLAIKDNQQNILAITYLIIDKDNCYQLFSGADPKYRTLNAPSILLWKAIEYAAQQKCKIYDFTGSIIPSIETFIRHFGAEQTPYLYVQKHYSTIYKLLRRLK
jgi:lipid II:glycine glycyltransferase (peptidoglycan interpeptide bridge formation enzyme)